jgi:conjugal transfer pilus assembly protein TraB
MTSRPDAAAPDDLFDPNESSRKRQRVLYLSIAALLCVLGGWYIWTQLGHSPAARVDETRRRVQATAELAKGPEAPEVVNADNARRADQLDQQLQDLQNQNLQLQSAAKQAEAAKNADHEDAARTIQALEDELNRRGGGAGARPAAPPPMPDPARTRSKPGAAAGPPLTVVPVAAGDDASDPPAGADAQPPHRTMSVIRVSAPSGPADATAPKAGAPTPPSEVTTDYANHAAPGPQGGGAGKGGAYISSRLETFDTANFVPPNAYAPAEILVGVDSATGVNTAADPKPVLLRITGDAVSVGSDGRYQRTRLRGCMVNGAAYGDLPSEKVYVKLQRITCPVGDHSFAVATVEGYISQKGKAGVRGLVVERSGGLTARAAIAGTLQGLGTTLASNFNRSISGYNGTVGANGVLEAQKLSPTEIAQGAVSGGVSTAASQLADYYIKRAEQYQPVIEMPTGATVEIVFLSGFQVAGT